MSNFDETKTYAAKKGLVAAIRKAGEDPANFAITQQPDGRWAGEYVSPADDFEATKEEIEAQTVRAVTYDLTDNEFHAAMVLVAECLNGMGGKRPSDLEHDEYTWCSADTLVAYGWSKESAAGTFSALDAKGVIAEYDHDTTAMSTSAWQWLDTKWDEHSALATTRKVEVVAPVARVVKKSAPAAAKVTMPTQNGIKAPRPDGLCGQAWAMFDALAKNGPFDVKAALKEGIRLGFNDNNVRTELCRWRKFHGIPARPVKE